MIYIDPTGEDIILNYGADCACLDDFIETINANFRGQLHATTEQVYDENGNVREGVARLKLDIVGGVENFENLQDGAKAFFEVVDFGDRIKKDININLVYSDPDPNVATGNFKQEKIDVADIKQWPMFDRSTSEQAGPTQVGKIAHEINEQTSKQIFGDNETKAHAGGILVEDRVNQNKRFKEEFTRGGSIQSFRRSNGQVTRYSNNFVGNRTIKVRKIQ